MNFPHFFKIFLLQACLFCCASNAEEIVAPVRNSSDIKLLKEAYGVREFSLKNGLSLLLIPDSKRNAVTTNLVYRSGSSAEKYGQKGIAHLLEHLLLIASLADARKKFPRAIPSYQYRGVTNFDFTCYLSWPGADTNTIKFALQADATRMSEFTVTVDQLEEAKRQVLHERETTEAGRFNFMQREATTNSFRWHAYGKDPLGIPSDLQNLTLSDMHEFWSQHYRPENATLIVSGKYNEIEILETVLDLFGNIKKQSSFERPIPTVEPPQNGEREIVILRNRTAPYAMIVYRAVDINHPDAAASVLLTEILGTVQKNRSKNNFTDPKKIKKINGYYMLLQQAGLMMFELDFPYGVSHDLIKTNFIQYLENLRRQPITGSELSKAKQGAAEEYNLTLQDSDKLAWQLTTYIAGGNWQRYFTLQQEVKNYELPQLQKKGEEWIVSSKRVAITLKEAL